MSAGLAISSLVTAMTPGFIFSARRANKSANSDNCMAAGMNLCIASGQIAKALQAATAIAKESKGELAETFVGADEAIKKLSKTEKVMQYGGKVLDFIKPNINWLIGLTGLVNVAFAKDKRRESIEQASAIGLMLAGEAATKRFIGTPDVKIKDGKVTVIEREAYYRKSPFLSKQVDAMKDYCETTKMFKNVKILDKLVKHVPAGLKGLTFVAGSIGCYALGKKSGSIIADLCCEPREATT